MVWKGTLVGWPGRFHPAWIGTFFRENLHRLVTTGWSAILAALALILPASLSAQTCPEPDSSDFRKVTLVDTGQLNMAVHLAVAPDGRVFIAEMASGNIKVFKPDVAGGRGQLLTSGTLPVRYNREDGLLGIALHPKFSENNWLFAFHTPSGQYAHELARFTLDGDRLDTSSKVVILRFDRQQDGRYHAGGGLAFDDAGNLVIGTGDDTNPSGPPNSGYGALYWRDPSKDAQRTAANSNDLRGKVLRIHPVAVPVDGKFYTIPEGNLFPPGMDSARPEIYAMGNRNPFRVGVDSRTGWIFWGDVGPDATREDPLRGRMGHDEVNVATKPGFFGWPYCHGNQFAYNRMDYSGGMEGVPGEKFQCDAIVNNSPNNTGIRVLPPAQPPILWYASMNTLDFRELGSGGETAMAGPMYRFDRKLESAIKFPPFYDGMVFFWDWTRKIYRMLSLDSTGKLKRIHRVPGINRPGHGISAQYGPGDGALYILEYFDGNFGTPKYSLLYRVEYTGPVDPGCRPVSATGPSGFKPAGRRLWVGLSGLPGPASFELPADARGAEVFDLQGRKVWSYRREGVQGNVRVFLPAEAAKGLIRIRLRY
jgi:cytochrome c